MAGGLMMPCEPAASDHLFAPVRSKLARLAALPQRDLRDVRLGKIPDAAVAEFPAASPAAGRNPPA